MFFSLNNKWQNAKKNLVWIMMQKHVSLNVLHRFSLVFSSFSFGYGSIFYSLPSVCCQVPVCCTVVIHTQLQFPYEIYSRCRSTMSEKVTSISGWTKKMSVCPAYSLLWLQQQTYERLIAFRLLSGFKISSDFETLLIGPVRRLNML